MLGELKTEEEIKLKIAKILKEKESLPEFSMFNDPNWLIADEQIRALDWVLGNTDEL